MIVGLVNDLTQTSIELDLPNDPNTGLPLATITLLRNKASNDTSKANNANAGANGSNLGTTPASNADTPAADSNANQYIGTTFDDSAPRSILNNAGGNASTGHFRPETGSLDATISGFTAARHRHLDAAGNRLPQQHVHGPGVRGGREIRSDFHGGLDSAARTFG